MSGAPQRVVALCGGVGGAKLAAGLAHELGNRLTLIVNTGDDFEHLGLPISPDLDTVLYTLAGLANRELGWGRQDETWNCLEALGSLGGETWFRLSDRDLALHLLRGARLRAGATLSAVTAEVAARLGIAARILPMSDDVVRTMVETDAGRLPFQHYFVARRAAPVVRRIDFEGAAQARPPAGALAALQEPGLRAVILCPSNPYLSIDPILAVPGLEAALARVSAPVVAVSPLIGGQAVKGPTAKIMAELGIPRSSAAVRAHYGRLLSGFVIDAADAAEAATIAGPVLATPTLMSDAAARVRLAREVLEFADRLAAGQAGTGAAP